MLKSWQHIAGEMSLPRSCSGNMIKEDIQIWNSPCRQEVSIKPYDNFIPSKNSVFGFNIIEVIFESNFRVSESSTKLWNQEYFALTFPKSSQPGSKKRSRPSELHITVPRHDIRKLEDVQKPAHIWIRHSLRKNFQRPSIYLTVRRWVTFTHYTPNIHHEKKQSKMTTYDKNISFKKHAKKNTGPHEKVTEFNKTVTDEKPKRENKAHETPLESSHASELSKKSIFRSETNLESKYVKATSMKDKTSNNPKERDTESKYTKKDSNASKHNSHAKSKASSKDSLKMESVIHLEESGDKSKNFDKWAKNYSQNNSKKPADTESGDSKDAKKDKKIAKRDSKKDAKKETESTGAESVDSKDKDAKKELKKGRKDSKKEDKKKDAIKDPVSTDAESLDAKDAKKDPKKARKGDKKKDVKKDALSSEIDSESEAESNKGKKDKKKDVKKDIVSTDADSESEWSAKKDKKDVKKKPVKKMDVSTETDSEWESDEDNKAKVGTKNVTKQDAKNIESTNAESNDLKKDKKGLEMVKSLDAESEEGSLKPGAKKKSVYESDASSADLKKETLDSNREMRSSYRKMLLKEQGLGTCTIPLSRTQLPPCETFLPSPRVRRPCTYQMPTLPPKPRYAPLPEAKWIHKLL